MSSANGVSASAISVAIIGTSRPCLRMIATRRRKILPDALRLDVASLAHREIDAVEAEFGGGRGQFLARQKLQVLGEDRDLELVLRLSRTARQQRAAPVWRVFRENSMTNPIYHTLRRSIIVDRRSFFVSGAGALAAWAAPPSERIVLGVIGSGGRGTLVMTVFQKDPALRVGAICDVYEPNLEKGALHRFRRPTARTPRPTATTRNCSPIRTCRPS